MSLTNDEEGRDCVLVDDDGKVIFCIPYIPLTITDTVGKFNNPLTKENKHETSNKLKKIL